MTDKQSINNQPINSNQPGFPPDHMTAFYTLIAILLKMKHEQGLEAMLDYMTAFKAVIDSHNPQLSQAVSQTLTRNLTGEIYEQMGHQPKKDC